jgi:hypothetical protein
MDQPEEPTHSFVVRIWRARSFQRYRLCGRITHVPDGEKRTFTRLDDMFNFMLPYLARMELRSGWHWQVRQWLRRSLRRSPPNQ